MRPEAEAYTEEAPARLKRTFHRRIEHVCFVRNRERARSNIGRAAKQSAPLTWNGRNLLGGSDAVRKHILSRDH
jgi:hypothetical protein